jgi:uncharacterized membrane protein SirB2
LSAVDDAALKPTHQLVVLLSVAGLVPHGLAVFAGSAWARGRIAGTLPHLVDTVLLLSALAWAWMLRLTPSDVPWLTAKIAGLLLYIYIGQAKLALRAGRRWRFVSRPGWRFAHSRLDRVGRDGQGCAGCAKPLGVGLPNGA